MPDASARQAEFWNRSAGSNVFSHPLDYSRFERVVARDASILDYGCGYGRRCGRLLVAGSISWRVPIFLPSAFRGTRMNSLMYTLLGFYAAMLAMGIVLPMRLGSASLSPALWDFLRLSGLIGLIVFGGIYFATKPNAQTNDQA